MTNTMDEKQAFSLSDIGLRRKNNEDVAFCQLGEGGFLLLVADGMGGHRKGEVASNLVLEVLKQSFRKRHRPFSLRSARNFFRKGMKEANKAIYHQSLSGDEFLEMGTTAVACLVLAKETQVVSVGDSRCYILSKDNQLIQITKDQSYVQMLFDSGKISREEMINHPQKNILTNSVGINPDLKNIEEFTLRNNDYNMILLCSDGLYNMVKDTEIESILSSSSSVEEKGKELIQKAIEHGGNDNIAVSLWEKK